MLLDVQLKIAKIDGERATCIFDILQLHGQKASWLARDDGEGEVLELPTGSFVCLSL